MAEQISHSHVENPNGEETREGGCFHFLTKGEEKKTEDDVVMADPNAAKECKGEKHTLLDELRHTHSHSTSSSDEEVEEGGGERQKKKKKGLKEVSEDKISEGEDSVPVEKCSEEGNAEMGQPEEEEKKGFLEKIKEKLPGQNKKGEDETQTPPAAVADHSPGSDKKGILDKIKEKLPGHHKNNENEVEI